jgi:hypothetical protein
VLRSLHALLYHYLPALFVIGHDVRRLTWEGGVRGTVKGDVAKRVLESCLALQVHLLGDWDARTEYCRTLAVALLGWQPYMTQLPGCAFVEEACEAMLSRMVGRCRANRNLQTVDDMQRLFVTLPQAQAEAAATTGGVQESLVLLLGGRVHGILASPDTLPYARVTGARTAHWEAAYPADATLPVAPLDADLDRSLVTVLQSALVSLTGPSTYTPEVMAVADATIPAQTSDQVTVDRQAAMQRIRQWATERRNRQREERQTASQGAGSQRVGRVAVGSDQAPAAVGGTARTDQHTGVVTAVEQATSSGALEGGSEPSNGGSLYEPPDDDGQFSEGYQSFGDTDSLGSIGELVEGVEADWTSLANEDWDGMVVDEGV